MRSARASLMLPLAALAFQGSAAAQSRNATPADTKATVSGIVVKLAGGDPLKSATVRLENADDHSQVFSGTTDAGGRFEVSGIEPGHYRLSVSRNGFVTAEYGQRSLNDPGSTLTLSLHQTVHDLLFRLVSAAVITGYIRNEDSDPLPWVRVSALRETYYRGRRRLVNEATVVTNDLGEYRLFGLRPGRYFVSASYKPGQKLDAAEAPAQSPGRLGYVPTYYPGTTDPARAVAIAVRVDDQFPAMDFFLEPTTVYAVRGRVTVPGRRTSDGVTLMLEPRTPSWAWGNQTRQATVEKADGSFEIPDVLPGSYSLVAILTEEGRRYQTRQNVEVTSGDAEGVQLTVTGGWNVAGQVVWDPAPGPASVSITLTARSVNTSAVFTAQARAAANGSFLLRELPEGTYQVAAYGQSADSYLKSIRFGGMEISDDEFNVARGAQQASLEVTISSRGARVLGAVTDVDGLPASGVWVVLVPDEAHRAAFHLFRQLTTDQYGHFDMRGIAPGDYTLFSWEHVEQNAWEDPDFLKDFDGKGQSVSLQEGDGKSAQLVAIRTASQDQQK